RQYRADEIEHHRDQRRSCVDDCEEEVDNHRQNRRKRVAENAYDLLDDRHQLIEHRCQPTDQVARELGDELDQRRDCVRQQPDGVGKRWKQRTDELPDHRKQRSERFHNRQNRVTHRFDSGEQGLQALGQSRTEHLENRLKLDDQSTNDFTDGAEHRLEGAYRLNECRCDLIDGRDQRTAERALQLGEGVRNLRGGVGRRFRGSADLVLQLLENDLLCTEYVTRLNERLDL